MEPEDSFRSRRAIATFSIICINDVACDSETLPICAIPQPVQTIREHSERTGHQKRAEQNCPETREPNPTLGSNSPTCSRALGDEIATGTAGFIRVGHIRLLANQRDKPSPHTLPIPG
jgi:hypothetical protein